MCCERVRDAGSRWPSYHGCERKSSVVRDGKPYCKIHDPVAKKEKQDAKWKQWQSKNAAENLRAELQRLAVASYAKLPDPLAAASEDALGQCVALLQSVASLFDEMDSVSWDEGSDFQDSSYSQLADEVRELLATIQKKS